MFPLISRDAELRAISNRFLRYSILLTLILVFLTFYFFPPFEFKPYRMAYEPPIELVFPDEIIIPEPPKEVPQPGIVVEVSDTEGVEETDVEIPPNVFSSTEEMPVAPRSVGPSTEQRFYAFDEAPVLIESFKPIYPEVAREVGIEGTVLLRLLVDENGAVIETDIIQSSVTPTMEEAAMAAARKYKFTPAKQRNVPVKAHVALPVIFKLN